MTSKERMLTALERKKPDRLPVTLHQWQDYHLRHYMDGMSAIEAFRSVKMDAAVTYFSARMPESPKWRISKTER